MELSGWVAGNGSPEVQRESVLTCRKGKGEQRAGETSLGTTDLPAGGPAALGWLNLPSTEQVSQPLFSCW